MGRVLVVLRGPRVERVALERLLVELTDAEEVAVCRCLPDGDDSLEGGLRAQREVTRLLRLVFGERAERVAVFVAGERDDAALAECAASWGATDIRD